MKVLIINGSPRLNGNCSILIKEVKKVFNDLKVDYEEIKVGNQDIRGCMACGYCKSHDGCVYQDLVNETSLKLKDADGLILVSPVYYSSPNGTLISFMDRLFQSSHFDISHSKPFLLSLTTSGSKNPIFVSGLIRFSTHAQS